MPDDKTKDAPAFPLVDNPAAPMIYFDIAPTFGAPFGEPAILLTATRHIPDPADPTGKAVLTQNVVVGNLRMNRNGLASLKAAIAGIELLLAPIGDKAN